MGRRERRTLAVGPRPASVPGRRGERQTAGLPGGAPALLPHNPAVPGGGSTGPAAPRTATAAADRRP